MKKEKITLESLANELIERFERWQNLYIDGGSDPFHSDGVNLNLVRNHILYNKRRIKEYCDLNGVELPNEYFFPVPDEVSYNYMAKADEILEKAKIATETVKNSDEIKELREIIPLLSDKNLINKASNILNRTSMRLENNNLVELRSLLYGFSRNMNELTEILPELRNDAAKTLASGNFPQLSLEDQWDIEEEEEYEDEFEN